MANTDFAQEIWTDMPLPPIHSGYGPKVSDSVQKPRIQILVADDDRRARQSLKSLLELPEYEISTASGGLEALEQLRGKRYDVVLLDLNMPDLNGSAVMEQIKTEGISTSVIVISGETTFDHATQAIRNGAEDFLRKPYPPDELLKTLANCVEKRNLKAEQSRLVARIYESDRLHRFIVNSSPDLIYMLDYGGHFIFLNERVTQLLGYEQGELVGQHYSILVCEDDLERAAYTFRERRTGERATRAVELRLRCKACDTARYFESRTVPIELNAMGMYDNNAIASDSYRGTYGVARDITERKQAEELIKYQLYHDLLTNLPNRILFRDRLNVAISHAKRKQGKLSIMYLDMDRFKSINDSLGHLAGDEILQAVAIRITECLRGGDTLARVGGDEFNLLLPEISSRDDACTTAKKILRTLEEPIQHNGQNLHITFSIGIAIFPDDGDSRDMLIRNADIAMYQVKSRGKNGFAFFHDSMEMASFLQLKVENELRQAIANDELRVFYQPQLDLVSNEVVGIEALVRWQHPERGLLTPAHFLSIAEEGDLIAPLSEWVLVRACSSLGRWIRDNDLNVTLSVNVASRQLEDLDFHRKVMAITAEFGIANNHLELEVTENTIMQDMEKAVTNLSVLSQQGVKIAVDDFGTGYSSLGYLQLLPLNTLKIDRSFVHGLKFKNEENSIVSAIIAMSNGLKLNLIAEGIEQRTQHNYLRDAGCAVGQGFLYSRPMPEEEIKGYLLEHGRRQ